MKRLLYAIMILVWLPVRAEPPSDQDLIDAEVRDSHSRQQTELRDRIQDLEAQQAASKAIAEKQQQLINALEAQIKALQEKERERSSRQE